MAYFTPEGFVKVNGEWERTQMIEQFAEEILAEVPWLEDCDKNKPAYLREQAIVIENLKEQFGVK